MIRLIPGASLFVEVLQLAVSALVAVVFLRKAGVDVIGRVRRWIGLDAPGGDRG